MTDQLRRTNEVVGDVEETRTGPSKPWWRGKAVPILSAIGSAIISAVAAVLFVSPGPDSVAGKFAPAVNEVIAKAVRPNAKFSLRPKPSTAMVGEEVQVFVVLDEVHLTVSSPGTVTVTCGSAGQMETVGVAIMNIDTHQHARELGSVRCRALAPGTVTITAEHSEPSTASIQPVTVTVVAANADEARAPSLANLGGRWALRVGAIDGQMALLHGRHGKVTGTFNLEQLGGGEVVGLADGGKVLATLVFNGGRKTYLDGNVREGPGMLEVSGKAKTGSTTEPFLAVSGGPGTSTRSK